ncbi:MAG TPA: uroporphyrinogen-III synthase [Candidatus Dormibacteraeota bacterium]
MTTVIVTRPLGGAHSLVRALEAAGYRVHAVPTVATQVVKFEPPDLSGYDWVAVTSAAGVEALEQLSPVPQWAAVGPATARALRARGIEPALVPDESSGLALANSLPDMQGKRVLLVRASAAASDLPERLRERGAVVDELAAYLTIEGPASATEPLRTALADGELAAVVFASGSAVRGYVALGGPTSLPAVTIGPRTTSVARDHGFHVIAEAGAQSVEALVAAVAGAIPVREGNHA